MTGFIRQPNPLAAKDAEIAELRAEVASWKNKAMRAEADKHKALAVVNEMEEECPECDNLCALQIQCDNANMDLAAVSHQLKTEWGDCSYWSGQLCLKGLNKELSLIRNLLNALECEKELALAIAHYNFNFCQSQGAPNYIDCKKSELEDLIENNPDIDQRCLGKINQVLCLICA